MPMDLLKALKKLKETKDTWFLDQVIPLGALTYIVGPPDAGKSEVTKSIIAAAMIGRDSWCGYKFHHRKLKILVLDGETGKVINKYMQHLGRRVKVIDNKKRFPTFFDETEPKLDTPAGWQYLLDLIKQYKPDVIIIDTLRSHRFSQDETAKGLQPVLQKLRALAHKHISVIVLHHAKKMNDDQNAKRPLRGSVDTAAGSYAGIGAVDVAWEYRRINKYGVLLKIRSRDIAVVENVPLKLVEDTTPEEKEAERHYRDFPRHHLELVPLEEVTAAMTKQNLQDLETMPTTSSARRDMVLNIGEDYLVRNPKANQADLTKYLMDKLGISRQTASKHARRLVSSVSSKDKG